MKSRGRPRPTARRDNPSYAGTGSAVALSVAFLADSWAAAELARSDRDDVFVTAFGDEHTRRAAALRAFSLCLQRGSVPEALRERWPGLPEPRGIDARSYLSEEAATIPLAGAMGRIAFLAEGLADALRDHDGEREEVEALRAVAAFLRTGKKPPWHEDPR